VEDPDLRAELKDTLDRCFADDSFAWELRPDGTWERRQGGERCVHRELMERALERAAEATALPEGRTHVESAAGHPLE
jgi:polyphosphate kinase